MSCYDLDLAFDLNVVTLTFKTLSRLYIEKRKIQEGDT